MSDKINMVDPATGKTYSVDETEAARLEKDERWTREDGAQKVERLTAERKEEEYGGVTGAVTAAGAGALRTVTGGLSDVAFRGLGVEDEFRDLKEVNPGASLVGEIGGALTGVGAAGLAANAGKAVARGAGGKIAGAVAGGVTEGAIVGTGSGVSAVALSADPLTMESVVSTIGSHALLGGVVGGAAGLVTKGAGAVLRKAKDKLDDVAARPAAGQLDAATGKAFVDDVAAFRKGTVDDELFLVTKGAADRETKALGKTWLEADKAVDRALRNPKALATKPDRVMVALQQQEHAFEQIIAKTDELTAKFASDTTGTRIAALQKVPAALERNKALQAKIGQLTAKSAEGGSSLAGNMLGGQAFGLGASLVGAIPVVGPLLAPIAGAAASKLVTEGLGKAVTAQAARASKAIGTFLDVGAKIAPSTPVLASKVLGSVAFGPPAKPERPIAKGKSAPKLPESYVARTTEIKSQTMYDPTGVAVMRPEARARIATQLAGVRATDPIAADRMETVAARRIEYLANKIPRKPDVAAMQTGPDLWQPSEMKMREFARIVAAVEDPIGVVERLANGHVTPEDAEAFKTVYPEMYADIQQQIMAQLPTLQKTLPYQRRLALSIFSGLPVDPAMHPDVLSALQAQYANEPGSEGGTQAPVPQPQFGSVRATPGTPSQRRQEMDT